MNSSPRHWISLVILAVGLSSIAHADEDATTRRMRELLHRTQEALQQAQSDNAALMQAKSTTEQKLAALTKELTATKSGLQASATHLQQQLQTAQQTAQSRQTELEARLMQINNQLEHSQQQERETAATLAARQTELDQTKLQLGQSRTATQLCEAKNVKLYSYAEQALQLYKKKGVWASLRQSDPVLGLKEVDVENVVQEYQLKYESQKINPRSP
jgi:chromosome segregation ATPase